MIQIDRSPLQVEGLPGLCPYDRIAGLSLRKVFPWLPAIVQAFFGNLHYEGRIIEMRDVLEIDATVFNGKSFGAVARSFCARILFKLGRKFRSAGVPNCLDPAPFVIAGDGWDPAEWKEKTLPVLSQYSTKSQFPDFEQKDREEFRERISAEPEPKKEAIFGQPLPRKGAITMATNSGSNPVQRSNAGKSGRLLKPIADRALYALGLTLHEQRLLHDMEKPYAIMTVGQLCQLTVAQFEKAIAEDNPDAAFDIVSKMRRQNPPRNFADGEQATLVLLGRLGEQYQEAHPLPGEPEPPNQPLPRKEGNRMPEKLALTPNDQISKLPVSTPIHQRLRKAGFVFVADLTHLTLAEFLATVLDGRPRKRIIGALLASGLSFADGQEVAEKWLEEFQAVNAKKAQWREKSRKAQLSKPAKIKTLARAKRPKKTPTKATSLVVRKTVGANLEPPAIRGQGAMPVIVNAFISLLQTEEENAGPERVRKVKITTTSRLIEFSVTPLSTDATTAPS